MYETKVARGVVIVDSTLSVSMPCKVTRKQFNFLNDMVELGLPFSVILLKSHYCKDFDNYALWFNKDKNWLSVMNKNFLIDDEIVTLLGDMVEAGIIDGLDIYSVKENDKKIVDKDYTAQYNKNMG